MRKRNLDYFFNCLFWFLALILPGIIWLILQCRSSVPISIETLLGGSSVESFAGILYAPLDGFFEMSESDWYGILLQIEDKYGNLFTESDSIWN